jgi:O-succinylbenzoate synthase
MRENHLPVLGLYVAIITQAIYDLAKFNRTGLYNHNRDGKVCNINFANLPDLSSARDVLYGDDWREIMLELGIEQSALRRTLEVLSDTRKTSQGTLENYKEMNMWNMYKELSSEVFEEVEKDHLTALV